MDKFVGQDLTRHLSCILIGNSRKIDSLPLNGSISLISIGGLKFGITCQHIVEKYNTEKKKDSKLIFQIGGSKIDVNERLIDQNREKDIAVFNLRGVKTSFLYNNPSIGKDFYMPVEWPPPEVGVGDAISICGFPGQNKKKKKSQIIVSTSTVGKLTVHGITDDFITVQFKRQEWIKIKGEDDSSIPIFLGGMSGGPVFLLKNFGNLSKILRYELVGIIKEHQSDLDIMVISRLSSVMNNGMIMK